MLGSRHAQNVEIVLSYNYEFDHPRTQKNRPEGRSRQISGPLLVGIAGRSVPLVSCSARFLDDAHLPVRRVFQDALIHPLLVARRGFPYELRERRFRDLVGLVEKPNHFCTLWG